MTGRAKKARPRKRQLPAQAGPKARAKVALIEVEDIVRRLLDTHRVSPWLDTEEAAKYLCRAASTLRGWRMNGGGPKHHVVNRQLIRYHVDDLDHFIRNPPPD